MARVLSISSQVVYGHVGNSVAAFTLQRLGHDVFAAPTVLLSNRPGYPRISGAPVPSSALEGMLEAGEANGWLFEVDAVFSGYLPTVEHVELCRCIVRDLKSRNPSIIYLCDPILGDEPEGIYIAEPAADAIRNVLVPLADILTPNRFELQWLSGKSVASLAHVLEASKSLAAKSILTTSAPGNVPGTLANVFIEGEGAAATIIPQRVVKAHGTGDFFAALFLAQKLSAKSDAEALFFASAAMEAALDASEGQLELQLVKSQDKWARPDLARVKALSLREIVD